jgi:hypothetical protein
MRNEFEFDLEHNLQKIVPYRKQMEICAFAQMNERAPEQERFLHPVKYIVDIANET